MSTRDPSAGSFPLPTMPHWSRLVAPAAAAAILGWAGSLWLAARPTVPDPDGEEIRYLARLALLILLLLLPAAALSHRRWPLLGWSLGTAGTAALLWMLPAGPLRGAAVSCLLLLALVASVAPERSSRLARRGLTARLVPAALACQCLALSSGLLAFPLDARSLVRLVALPLAAAGLAALVARRAGALTAAVALVSVLAIAGRFSTAVLVALLVPVLAPLLADLRRTPATRLLALAALAAPGALDPVLGVSSVLGALALVGRRAWPAAVVVAIGLLALGPAARSWLDAATLLPALVLVLPFGAVRLAHGALQRDRDTISVATWELAAPLLLAWIGLRFGDPRIALAVPAVLMATGLGRSGAHQRAPAEDRRPGAGSRWRWAGTAAIAWPSLWLAGSLLAGAYPWLRDPGVHSLLEQLGLLQPGWLLGALALALVVLLALTLRTSEVTPRIRATPPRAWVPAAAMALLLASPLLRLGGASFVLTWPPVELGQDRPAWESAVVEAAPGARSVVVDSAVAFSAGVEPGSILATLRWVPAVGRGGPFAALRLGQDSAEWNATTSRGPSPWLSLVGPDHSVVGPDHSVVGPDRRSFVHRYRARRELGELPPGPGRLVVELSPDLPPELRLSLYRVTLATSHARPDPRR